MRIQMNAQTLGLAFDIEITPDEMTALLAYRASEPVPGSLQQSDARISQALATSVEDELRNRKLSEALAEAVSTYACSFLALVAKAKAMDAE